MSTVSDALLLLPPPRRLVREAGAFDAARGGTIHLGSERPADLWFTATQLQGWLAAAARQCWPIRAGVETAAIRLITDPALPGGPEAYRLTITPQAVEVVGGSPAGVFYGC